MHPPSPFLLRRLRSLAMVVVAALALSATALCGPTSGAAAADDPVEPSTA